MGVAHQASGLLFISLVKSSTGDKGVLVPEAAVTTGMGRTKLDLGKSMVCSGEQAAGSEQFLILSSV